ncbi:DNA topoisomerase 3 [Variovorax sp. LT1P1]|uniref:DNA topoisomerase 3 n=1 Tax=Variovorax sp. LT1P1 TaxID=3443730 RepID=UPI003F461DD4
MRRLFIAEKPSVATELAQLLGVTRRERGFFICGDDVVSSCFGHLYEMPKPEYYDKALSEWAFANMPIVPSAWVVLPKDDARDRIKLLTQFMREVDVVVNAGDPDNEGQLLVDEVIEKAKFRGQVLRFWASAQDPASLQAAMENLRDNRDFAGMRDSARGRGRADWLIGMNASRAFTLRAQAKGNRGVVPVGRVMTPTLAMVAAADEKFANFKPVPYHFVTVLVRHADGEFRMRWQPREDQVGLDEEGRLVDTAVADELVARIAEQPGAITEYKSVPKTERQPKGLSLAGIGLLASEMFGYSAAETLQICQALYETHKLTSYPRTDCEYLPENQHGAAPAILDALRDNLPAIAPWIDGADASIKSKTWDDAKITAHHGIIPTSMRADTSRLAEWEMNLYQLIVRQYIAQFYPVHAYDENTVHASAIGEAFAARGRLVTEHGWKQLFQAPLDPEDDTQDLPVMQGDDPVQFGEAVRHDKRTTAPKRFTEGTLPPAMENVFRYMEDPEDRKTLKDGDGIGTPATRGAIIEELKRRGFLTNSGKWLVSTEAGRAVLAMLPPEVKSPSLTAHFQRQLREIEQGARSIEQFVSDQVAFVSGLVGQAQADLPVVERIGCPDPDCAGQLRRVARRDNSGHFWSCSAWRATGCKASANDVDGQPDLSQFRMRNAQAAAG